MENKSKSFETIWIDDFPVIRINEPIHLPLLTAQKLFELAEDLEEPVDSALSLLLFKHFDERGKFDVEKLLGEMKGLRTIEKNSKFYVKRCPDCNAKKTQDDQG